MNKVLLIVVAVLVLCPGCVTTKRYNELKARTMRLEAELSVHESALAALRDGNAELSRDRDQLLAEIVKVQAENRELSENYSRLANAGSEETGRMLRQLEENNKRLEELEGLLKAREEMLSGLRKRIGDALLGFEGRGLTIATRNGNVYVSLEDKLLFRSGSYEIDPEGARAVRELGSVLAQNPDINILVEGHTDDVPYRGSGQLADNLDLSVKRATTVVRLLLENDAISPKRVTAAGRGEFLPVAAGTSPEERARNRRTDIILSPNMEELFSIMDR